jgi:hypothetical protein
MSGYLQKTNEAKEGKQKALRRLRAFTATGQTADQMAAP